MKRVIQRFLATAVTACLLFSGAGMEEAWASGEKVSFGSEAYEWELNMEAPYFLGVYASADGELEAAELYVVYDPEMLEFVSGGEEVEPGRVKVQSSEIEGTEFKRIMSFTPLMGGNTEVRIEGASVDSGAGNVAAAGASVPVSIAIPRGCALSGIAVNGTPVNGFDAGITDYTLDLEEYTEQADVTLLPENINAEISDTKLSEGENEIHIMTTNEDGDQARYTLHVNCPKQAVPAVTEPEVTDPQPEETAPEENVDEGSGSIREMAYRYLGYAKEMAFRHKLLSAALGVLVIAFIILMAMKVHIRRRRKRAERERKRRIRENQENKRKAQEQETDDTWDDVLNLETDGENTSISQDGEPDRTQAETLKAEVQASGEALGNGAEIEIEVKNVTMDFKREKDESTSIKELVIRTLKRQRSFEYFRALDDVSFTVRKGEVVGIIGTNGSGKSTILKIISGVLAPSKGSVNVDKRKIQLLTLGTGFDMELTGRENVYLNGAIIGYTKEYIDEKYDDIVKFAELGGFMEEKVRNYSSGMVSRLGFAIATARDTPEILILDEVLSVGDMFFRKKSEARIQEMIHGGSTVLIVSHSTSVIRKNCTKVVWIEKGKLRAVGDPKEVCAAYEKMNG